MIKRLLIGFILLFSLVGCKSEENYSYISEIKITIDLENNEVLNYSEEVDVILETDYIDVTVTITAIKDYYFLREIKLYINDELIDYKKYSYAPKEIIYVYEEPNWTKPY